MFLGIAFSVFMIMYSELVFKSIENILFWTEVGILKKQVKYTMNFLTDFKPVPQLDKFLGRLLLELLNFWTIMSKHLSSFSPLIYLMAPIGVLGISFQFALVHDFLTVVTSHIHSIYFLFAFLHRTVLEVLTTLMLMFRGKKFNILKQKVDAAEYKIEELLLGILVLVTTLFLLPTLLVYYISIIYLMVFIVVLISTLVILMKLSAGIPIYAI